MISTVFSCDAYHDCYVQEKAKELQNSGYEVTKITQVKKMFLGFIGNDVTEIQYKKGYSK